MIGRLWVCAIFAASLNCDTDAQAPDFYRPDSLVFYPALSTTSGVTWSATCGTVDQTGLYRAPSTTGTCRVIATAGGKADTATVTVTSATVTRSLAAGFWNYPPDQWCDGYTSGTTRPFPTYSLLGYLQQAKKCTLRLTLVPSRRFLTTTGTNGSPFSLDSAKAFTDRMAKILVPDTLRKYDPYIIGFNLADDYNSTDQWGGTTVSPAQIEAWARYVRSKIPGLRIGVRVTPDWVTSSLASVIDYTWAQYHTGKGDAKTYFDKHAAGAKALGLAIAMGVNVEDCGGNGTAACTPTQIRAFMGLAVGYPQNCAALGWTYSSTTLGQTGMRDAWDYVLGLANQHPDVPCKHS